MEETAKVNPHPLLEVALGVRRSARSTRSTLAARSGYSDVGVVALIPSLVLRYCPWLNGTVLKNGPSDVGDGRSVISCPNGSCRLAPRVDELEGHDAAVGRCTQLFLARHKLGAPRLDACLTTLVKKNFVR